MYFAKSAIDEFHKKYGPKELFKNKERYNLLLEVWLEGWNAGCERLNKEKTLEKGNKK